MLGQFNDKIPKLCKIYENEEYAKFQKNYNEIHHFHRNSTMKSKTLPIFVDNINIIFKTLSIFNFNCCIQGIYKYRIFNT